MMSELKIVWLCGSVKGSEDFWEVNGIFSTEQKAVNRCNDRFDFVAPFNIDEEAPVESCDMIGSYYPITN